MDGRSGQLTSWQQSSTTDTVYSEAHDDVGATEHAVHLDRGVSHLEVRRGYGRWHFAHQLQRPTGTSSVPRGMKTSLEGSPHPYALHWTTLAT